MKIISKINFLFSIKNFPILLLFFIFIVYGYQINRMGIYWDDWQAILLSNLDVPNAFWNYYLFDRPISIWTYVFPLPILQNYPVLWQIYGILARWFAAFGLWVFLRVMFPNRHQEIGWITLLWSVYPGFFTQSVSIAYCQHFITYGLFNFSLAVMVRSIRNERHSVKFTILGVVLALLNMLTMEYFVGLEFLRPVIIILLADKQVLKGAKLILYTFKKWLPYIVGLLIFVFYRFWLLDKINNNQTGNNLELLTDLLTQPIQTSIAFLQMVAQDLVYLLFSVWGKTVNSIEIDLQSRTYLFSLFVGIVFAVVFYMIISKWKTKQKSNDEFFSKGLIFSIIAILFGGLPVWFINRQVIVGLWSDRFALPMMLGVCVLFVFFWKAITINEKKKNIILALFLMVSISYQIRVVNDFQNNWLEQERFYWQVMWRAPSIDPGTAILSPTMPFGSVAEYSIWFALNAIYDQNIENTTLDYVYLSATRHRYNQISDFAEDGIITGKLRSLFFTGSTSSALVFYEEPKQRCYWFVNPDDAYLPNLNQEEKDLFSISHLDQIDNEHRTNSKIVSQLFGAEINHNWCYFYQKAELAAQFENWNEIGNLKAGAENVGEKPEHGRELFPFIQAYAHLDQWDQVKIYTLQALDLTVNLQERTCLFLRQIDKETFDTNQTEQKTEVMSYLMKTLSCNIDG